MDVQTSSDTAWKRSITTTFLTDRAFATAVAVGFAAHFLPADRPHVSGLAVLASLLIWQPVFEEILFRGVILGGLGRIQFFTVKSLGLSRANICVSCLFSATHFINHPPLWAASVFIPSLVFGYFRERHDSLAPPVALHVWYNTAYLFI